ncbi:hypothetical protein OUZ56_007153 [Daphnia magna]|uniref:Uncharacterized protein n=1 Tax=Daphnia magna TaxID=35525 RepID=A0ABQ9YXW6_9CRUS|nr:hypothetical protein OUZ56_007153 [Daphnia magna]
MATTNQRRNKGYDDTIWRSLLLLLRKPQYNIKQKQVKEFQGPHSVQEVPDSVRPGRQFAIISRKPFALPAKQTPYTCPMRRALIINAFIPASHFCQNRPKTTSHEILQKSDGIIEIKR